MDKYNKLRNEYPIFEYNSYDIKDTGDEIFITYNFCIPSLTEFNPTWKFKKTRDLTCDEEKLLNLAIFNLGMVEVISYLKSVCSKKLVVRAGKLNKEQIDWFKKLYVNGLGEFFYRNNIVDAMNLDTFLEIVAEENNEPSIKLDIKYTGNIIPVGGGKDSNLTLEVLKDMDNICFIVNPRGASLESAKVAGYSENKIYSPKRTLDKKLLELNDKGFLNGHTPFSAILAFSSYIAAILLGRKNIVLSNEASANEANVSGTNINHQYSKSIEFENDFREYVTKYLSENGPNYFSLLRPLTEWQIVKNFVKSPKYFKVFKSCNVGSKKDIWCENCPKCLYVYIMLKAFLTDDQMAEIFKENMLENESLRDIFNGLVYPDYDKPFECVGTKDEINLSLSMIERKCKQDNTKLPELVKGYNTNINNLEDKINEYSKLWNNENNLPEEFEIRLRNYIK